ncbi:hypothetical protein M501DRAFT_1017850 [Patellaria atrata CBS 101060]|uniref:Uncharacterized protein n=1 Tax=Patellaria atrata CBS 101060 TaxID=1346257 RepID=A0A9P4S940_9PEZI|nr:hypothetical protein M501DRAFT_1017850 [Patellaria atrata CBS 101060]
MFRQLSKTTFRQMAYVHHPRATCPPGTKIRSVRRFHRAPVAYARKDTQHKDSLKPDRAEYSQSGGDDAAAKTEKAAFDPNQTRPEHEEPTAKQESGGTDVSDAGNPLNVSPGNKDVSEAQPDKQQQSHRSTSESGQGSSRGRTSGSGGAPKAGGGKSG